MQIGSQKKSCFNKSSSQINNFCLISSSNWIFSGVSFINSSSALIYCFDAYIELFLRMEVASYFIESLFLLHIIYSLSIFYTTTFYYISIQVRIYNKTAH